MSRRDNFRKWHREMDASLIKMYASGNYSVSDFARKSGAPASTIYDQMRRLRLPLLGQSGCKLRNYKSYGPRYNETIFSQEQVALLAHRNAEGWSDSMIARELRLSPNPVRRLRKRLGLLAHVRKAIPIGIRYGNLVVQKAVSRKRKKTRPVSNSLASRSLCQCDCGGQRIVFNEDLRSGNTTTCGCHINVRNLDSEWIRVFHQYLGGAKRRGVSFTLSVEQVKQICSLPDATAALRRVMSPCLLRDATEAVCLSGTTESTRLSLVPDTILETCCLAAVFVIEQRAIWPWKCSFIGLTKCLANA